MGYSSQHSCCTIPWVYPSFPSRRWSSSLLFSQWTHGEHTDLNVGVGYISTNIIHNHRLLELIRVDITVDSDTVQLWNISIALALLASFYTFEEAHPSADRHSSGRCSTECKPPWVEPHSLSTIHNHTHRNSSTALTEETLLLIVLHLGSSLLMDWYRFIIVLYSFSITSVTEW